MPHYEALSYRWDSESSALAESVLVDGKQLSITAGLHDALRHLRLPDRDRYLWIDQICIDQQNVSEKNYQVRRMGEIYANAKRVVTWLGRATDATENFFSALDRVDDSTATCRSIYFLAEMQPGKPIYTSVMAELNKVIGQAQFPLRLRKKAKSDTSSEEREQKLAWALLEEVLSNEWFERMWILQEVALAHDLVVQASKHVIPWRRFVGAMRIIAQMAQIPPVPPKNYQSVEVAEVLRHTWYSLDGPQIKLERMLEYSRPREAGDVRDKVYGIMGLYTPWSVARMPAGENPLNASDAFERVAFSDYYAKHGVSGPPLPIVDYNRSVAHVFIDSAVACLASGRLDVLRDCCAREESLPEGTEIRSPLHGHFITKNATTRHQLPSWVTDWSIIAGNDCKGPLIDDLRTKEQPYFASRKNCAEVKVVYEQGMEGPAATSLQNTALALTGLMFDEVSEIVQRLHTFATLPDSQSRHIWKEWWQLALSDSEESPYTNGLDGCVEALWRTLISDKPNGLDTERADAIIGKDFKTALTTAMVGGDLSPGHEARMTLTGQVYYVDHETHSTSWIHPRDESITDAEYQRYAKQLNDWFEARGNRHMNKRLFRTRRGYLGMSCKHVQQGDHVAVLWGGRLPHILRPRARIQLVDNNRLSQGMPTQDLLYDGEDGRVTYELIGGECYVYGLSEGQALDIARKESLQASTVFLQ